MYTEILTLWQGIHSYKWNNKDDKFLLLQNLGDKLSNILDTRPKKSIIELLLSMTLYTRNIAYGLGERQLTYVFLLIWYKYFPVLAVNLLSFIVGDVNNKYPCGSWRDIVGLCKYIYEKEKTKKHPLLKTAIEMMNKQLHADWIESGSGSGPISNVAKWIPRENSQHSWLFELMVIDWTLTYSPHIIKETSKCKRQYRQIFSSLTRIIDPVEVKQCSGKWNEIDPSKVTKGALQKYRFAFNREVCADTFRKYYSIYDLNHTTNDYSNYNLHYDLSRYVQDAINCKDKESENECNHRWNHFLDTRRIRSIQQDDYLPIISCNTHQIMDPIFLNALGHAYLLSTRSSLGRCILFAGLWINLDNENENNTDFVSSIKTLIKIIQCQYQQHSNIELAMAMIPPNTANVKYVILGNKEDVKIQNDMLSVLGQPPFLLLLP